MCTNTHAYLNIYARILHARIFVEWLSPEGRLRKTLLTVAKALDQAFLYPCLSLEDHIMDLCTLFKKVNNANVCKATY